MNALTTMPRLLQREQRMKFGTQMLAQGVRFRLWAPYSKFVALKIYDLDLVVPMQKLARGWYEVEVETARPGMHYRFVLDDGSEVPDPASRYQPQDVDGPSEIIDPLDFGWTDIGWRGHEWEELVLYELHIGTFTPEGTFSAAMEKLDHLVELGVTAIEIMPIADFPGRWNWGYDGAQLFAPDSSYGRPEDLKALVDRAHEKGISVFLDVVYNHFGPKGNYLAVYTPLTTDHYETPWGSAVNFDAAGSGIVREFFFANARYWLNEFHLDGLRLDAVHEIRDAGFRHMLQELAEQIRAATDGRHVHLVVENEKNEAGWLKRRDDGAPWLYNGQWSDDIHHGLHVALTGESHWYYADYKDRTDLIGRALAEGLAWQGEYMEHEGRHRGEPSTFLPANAFIAFTQNHDQIGNRPFGERPTVLTSPAAIRMWAAINLLSPQVPMLFMGEEWGTKQPFLFFSDVGEDLADPIREGRMKELEKFPHREGDVPPDPMSEETFNACKLDWSWGDSEESNRQHWLYRRLLSVRRKEIVPRLAGMTGESGHYQVLAQKVVRVWWTLGDGSELSMVANVGTEPFQGVGVWGEDHLWLEGSASGDTLDSLSVVFSLQQSAN